MKFHNADMRVAIKLPMCEVYDVAVKTKFTGGPLRVGRESRQMAEIMRNRIVTPFDTLANNRGLDTTLPTEATTTNTKNTRRRRRS